MSEETKQPKSLLKEVVNNPITRNIAGFLLKSNYFLDKIQVKIIQFKIQMEI